MERKYQTDWDECLRVLKSIKERIDKDKFEVMNSYLISYSLVKACGTVEVIFKRMVADRVSSGSSKEVVNYFDAKIVDSSFNPSYGRIKSLLEDFNEEWSKEFVSKLIGCPSVTQLKSLVALRNSFSHGKDVSASIENVIEYFEASLKILVALGEAIQDGGSQNISGV